MSVYSDLYNSGQAYLYVFVSPKANVSKEIMAKRVQQLNRLSAMYAKDQTYTPAQMIEILRAGIEKQYGKSPELILQIIYDNALRISKKGISGNYDGLTYDGESGQYYDGSGNAYTLSSGGAIATKNGQAVTGDAGTIIENPTNLEAISVSKSGSGSFWQDVASVIEWIANLLSELGITSKKTDLENTVPTSSDWANLNTGSTASFGAYLPYVIGAGIVITALMGTDKKKKKTT